MIEDNQDNIILRHLAMMNDSIEECIEIINRLWKEKEQGLQGKGIEEE